MRWLKITGLTHPKSNVQLSSLLKKVQFLSSERGPLCIFFLYKKSKVLSDFASGIRGAVPHLRYTASSVLQCSLWRAVTLKIPSLCLVRSMIPHKPNGRYLSKKYPLCHIVTYLTVKTVVAYYYILIELFVSFFIY